VSVPPRIRQHYTLPSPCGSNQNTQDHQWSSEPQDRVFGNCETNQTCAGRPKLPIWLSTSAIIAFSCECATSRSSRLSLSFGMTNATATCPFSASFTPTTATSATPG